VDVKALRLKLGFTQEQLAQQLGVSWGTVARWEAGRSKPSRLALKAIENLTQERKVDEV